MAQTIQAVQAVVQAIQANVQEIQIPTRSCQDISGHAAGYSGHAAGCIKPRNFDSSSLTHVPLLKLGGINFFKWI